MKPRTNTPDEHVATIVGEVTTRMHLKRHCNGCDTVLGDLGDRDVDDNGELTDVRAECGNCAPLVELEAAGCKTWQLTRRDICRIDDEIDRHGVFAKGYFRAVDGQVRLVGLRIGEKPGHVVALFGDWIIRHPDGQWSVHKAPPGGAS